MTDLTGKTLGKYRLIERLGRGGMADVYRAEQPGLQRQVAVKVMHSYLAEDADFVRRFSAEARAVAALRHPNILQIYDFEVQADVSFMVMEYLPGGTLRDRLQLFRQQGQRMTLPEAARLVGALAGALDFAHASGHVHGDIKPANILFDGERPVLADFGLATLAGVPRPVESGVLPSAPAGTPVYMSPEQCRGEPAGARSDVYALGVLLYEIVCGQPPFDGVSPREVLLKQLNTHVPPPSQLASDISPALERVLLTALEKTPEARYPSAGALAGALTAAIASSNTITSSQPAGRRGNWLGWGLALVLLAVLIVLGTAAFGKLLLPGDLRQPPAFLGGQPLPAAEQAAPLLRKLPDTTSSIHIFSDELAYEQMTEAQFEFAATHYAGAQKLRASDAARLRSLNPGFMVLNYRLGLGLGFQKLGEGCAPTGAWIEIIEGDEWVREFPAAPQEAWFYHWEGQRVLHCAWGWYVMELNDPGWRNYWAGEALRQLEATQADGVFLDSLSVPNYQGGEMYDPPLPEIDAAFELAWSQRIQDFIAFAQSGGLAPYWVVVNVGEWVNSRDATDYSAADGIFVDGFARWGEGDYFDPAERDWQLQIARVFVLAADGKLVILQQNVDPANVDDRLFILGSYLLVKGSHTFLNLEASRLPEWFPEYDIPIGSPLETLTSIQDLWRSGWGLYARDYSNGLVVVNPSSETLVISLGETLYQAAPEGGGAVPADGDISAWAVSYTPVTSVTLPPNTAALLLRALP